MVKNIRDISDITPDPDNANRGTERGRYMVAKSIETVGTGRSVLVDKDGMVIAGNKTLEAAEDAGFPITVVRTDGHALVVHQRTDLDLDSEDGRARLMAYFDNRSSEVGLEWDEGQIATDIEGGLDLSEMFCPHELEELAVMVPEFAPIGEGEQPRLEKPVVCPECGHRWVLNR